MVSRTDTPTSPAATRSIFSGLGESGKERTEAMVAAQAEFLDRLREINQLWFERAKSEVELATELAAKLAHARSVPESATAYQEWATRRMQLALEDGQRLFADSVKLMETSARLFSSGGTGGAA
jgi:hypothetical protein